MVVEGGTKKLQLNPPNGLESWNSEYVFVSRNPEFVWRGFFPAELKAFIPGLKKSQIGFC